MSERRYPVSKTPRLDAFFCIAASLLGAHSAHAYGPATWKGLASAAAAVFLLWRGLCHGAQVIGEWLANREFRRMMRKVEQQIEERGKDK